MVSVSSLCISKFLHQEEEVKVDESDEYQKEKLEPETKERPDLGFDFAFEVLLLLQNYE